MASPRPRWLLIAATLAGCSGSPSSPQGVEGGPGSTDGDAATSTSSGTNRPLEGVEPVDLPADCSPDPSHVVLQRLTRDEYDRTVADLFGATSAPARSFPPDSATQGFDNNAKSLTVSPQLFELLLDAAEQVAAEAMEQRGDEILSCDPMAMGETQCADLIVRAQARRIYRRPPSDTEANGLVDLVSAARQEGEDFPGAIEHALAAMLVTPQFLFRGIPAEGAQPVLDDNGNAWLDQHALATRLSYFLWGSTPDEALLETADAGGLSDGDMLRSEFSRLLADDRASFLFSGFFSRWLSLGKLEVSNPDPSLFPEFDEQLRQDMNEEVRLFFDDVLERDASPLSFISATQTFANESLANLYGVSGVSGSDWVPVDLDPAQRAGVLTMPAVLAMTSDPDHTNIVKRGAWMADTILCAKPPPPPDGVPPLPDAMADETPRQRLERHRADPACAPCHDLIDPLGYPFENYGPLGAWRDDIDGTPVDSVGQLPDGRSFDTLVEMARELQATGEYGSCFTERMMTYALGRTMAGPETCVVAAIGEQTVRADSKFSDLLWAIVTSDAFQKQDGENP
jgi:hypothetical protein